MLEEVMAGTEVMVAMGPQEEVVLMDLMPLVSQVVVMEDLEVLVETEETLPMVLMEEMEDSSK